MRGSQTGFTLSCMTPLATDGEDLDELVAKTRVCFAHLYEALFGGNSSVMGVELWLALLTKPSL